MQKLKIKRIYEAPDESDGIRILIDRIWPRGIKKADAKIDLWLKDIAPSKELRKSFSHDREKWLEFKQLYIEELKSKKLSLDIINQKINKNDITLLYGAKDTECNNAIVLEEYLSKLYIKRQNTL